ncbi:MAG: GIY-YIG nuclease family protein, partial [Bacteroidales bacterium]
GQTKDVRERLKRHNSGREKFTSKGKPWQLVFYTWYDSRAEAMKLERKLKNLKSQERIKKFIGEELSKGRGSRKIEN